jgi:hypothetical protein
MMHVGRAEEVWGAIAEDGFADCLRTDDKPLTTGDKGMTTIGSESA